MNILIFYVFFGVCFICFVIRSSYYVLANRGNELAESKRFITILFAVMFILWFAWFFMSFRRKTTGEEVRGLSRVQEEDLVLVYSPFQLCPIFLNDSRIWLLLKNMRNNPSFHTSIVETYL